MPYNYDLIPYREDTNGKPSYWLAGFSPNTIRFEFNPTVIVPLDAAWIPTNILSILVAGAPTGYSVGDVVYLSDGTTSYYGSISQIIDFGGSFSLQVTFPSYFSLPGATIYHGVRSGSYVVFNFLDPVTSFAFATARITPQNTGKIMLDMSEWLQGQHKLGVADYNYQTPNWYVSDFQKEFVLSYTEFPQNTTTQLPEIFEMVSGGFNLKENNFNSSNYIDYLPSSATPGKWLNPIAAAGLSVPVWSGLPWGINFIYPDDVVGLNANTPAGPILFDATQAGGVNFLTLSEADFGTDTEFCFEVGGQAPPTVYKEISGNFRYGGLNDLTYQLTEAMPAVAFEGLFGTSQSLVGFYYGATIGSLTLYPFAMWKMLVASAPVGSYIKLVYPAGDADNPWILRWGVPSILPSFSQALPFDDASVGLDITLPFNQEVAMSGTIAGCFAGIRTASAATDDWSAFPYDLSSAVDVAAMNAAIAALAVPQDYCLHVWSGDRTAKAMTLTYTTAQRQRIAHVEEDNNYKYRAATDGLSNEGNGINQYVYIPSGINQAAMDRGAVFSGFFSFYYDVFDPNPFIFSTTTWKGGVVKGLRIELSGNLWANGWQTGGGANLDYGRSTVNFVPGFNLAYFEYDTDINSLRMWINKREVTVQVVFTNGVGTIVNGYNDAELMTYASQAGGGNYFKGKLKNIQLITGLLDTEKREKAINAGSLQGIVPDGDFILDIDLTVVPPIARTGTPAFGAATAFGGVTNPIYLP